MRIESEFRQNSTVGVPLLRYAYVDAMLAQLKAANQPVASTAGSTRLPLLVDDPRTLVPKRPFFLFVEAAWNPEVALVGLDAGLCPATSGPILDAAGAAGDTLFEGLRALLHRLQGEANEAPMGLEMRRHGAWLWHRGLEQPRDGSRPGLSTLELLPCGVFLAMIWRYLGPHWQPRVIQTQAWRNPAALHERFPRTRFQVGQAQLGIWLSDQELLAQPRQRASGSNGPAHHDVVPTDLVGGLKAVLDVNFQSADSAPMTLGLAAELSRLSERALQRRLAERGTSYREIYAQAMSSSAKRSLAGDDKTIAEVAALHGYDASHFIRAFRQATGVTPGRYRQLCQGY